MSLEEFEVDYEIESSKKGITGQVTSYSYTTREYPYILLENLTSASKSKLIALRGIITPPATSEYISRVTDGNTHLSNPDDKRYHIYTELKGDVYEMGTVTSSRLSSVIDSIGLSNISKVVLDKDTVIMGDMIYSLIPVRSH